MKTLSQRLEDLAAREYVVEVGPHGTVVDDAFDADTKELIREAAALAKRYEDAPVGFVRDDDVHCTWDQVEHLNGQRVRIVLDKEG